MAGSGAPDAPPAAPGALSTSALDGLSLPGPRAGLPPPAGFPPPPSSLSRLTPGARMTP